MQTDEIRQNFESNINDYSWFQKMRQLAAITDSGLFLECEFPSLVKVDWCISMERKYEKYFLIISRLSYCIVSLKAVEFTVDKIPQFV